MFVRRLRGLLPILLFLSGAFPSRGLYFLLHDGARTGIHRTRQPALDKPASRTTRLSPPKAALPKRLSKIPRALKETPDVSAPALAAVAAPSLHPNTARIARAVAAPPLLRPFASAAPSSRAPPVPA